jgi:phosphohistidine phosphatase
MALTISSPAGDFKKSPGLLVWMDRVLYLTDKIEPGWDADDIHDLRVALRRSRTMAEALREVNPAPEWHKLKKGSRDLFHALGDLRDTQVTRFWIKKLGPAGDPVRKHMLHLFTQREKKQRKLAKSALKDFDHKSWRKWKRKLAQKAEFFPPESVVFQRLALARLHAAFDLYQQARKKRSSVAWHRLRIGIKQFRYIAEDFLRRRYERWAEDLKHFQDMLGEVHDWDVLRACLRQEASKLDPARVARWLGKIEKERKARLREFLQKSSAGNSPWIVWRRGFQSGHVLVAAPFPERRTA